MISAVVVVAAVSLFSKDNMLFRSSCPGQKGLPGGTPTEQETPMMPASMMVPSRERVMAHSIAASRGFEKGAFGGPACLAF